MGVVAGPNIAILCLTVFVYTVLILLKIANFVYNWNQSRLGEEKKIFFRLPTVGIHDARLVDPVERRRNKKMLKKQ